MPAPKIDACVNLMFLVFTTGFHPGGQLYDVTKVILYFHSGNNYTGKSFQKSPNLSRLGLSITPMSLSALTKCFSKTAHLTTGGISQNPMKTIVAQAGIEPACGLVPVAARAALPQNRAARLSISRPVSPPVNFAPCLLPHLPRKSQVFKTQRAFLFKKQHKNTKPYLKKQTLQKGLWPSRCMQLPHRLCWHNTRCG